MPKFLKLSTRLLKSLGINPKDFLLSAKGLLTYSRNFIRFYRQKRHSHKTLPIELFPCLADRFKSGGDTSNHYFIQDLYVAQLLYDRAPSNHIDIGSRIDGFSSHVASYRELDIIDIRPTSIPLPNMNFIQADCMASLPAHMIGKYESASCLHALEHFGLGRYGDTIDIDGHIKGLKVITKLLQDKGTLYISVPIGPQRVEFDAHRVFSIDYLLPIFSQDFDIESFSYINDEGTFFPNANLNTEDIKNNYNCHYGCGIFQLTKI